MALSDQQIVNALMPAVEAMKADDIRRGQRVDRRIGDDSLLIIEPPVFWRTRSPDGSIWRIKVSNTGAITASKE